MKKNIWLVIAFSMGFNGFVFGASFNVLRHVKQKLGFSLNSNEEFYHQLRQQIKAVAKQQDRLYIWTDSTDESTSIEMIMHCAGVLNEAKKKILTPSSYVINDLQKLVLEATPDDSVAHRRPELLSRALGTVHAFINDPKNIHFNVNFQDVCFNQEARQFSYQVNAQVRFLAVLPCKQVKAFICAHQKSEAGAHAREDYLYPIIFSYLNTPDISKIPYPPKGWADNRSKRGFLGRFR